MIINFSLTGEKSLDRTNPALDWTLDLDETDDASLLSIPSNI